INAQPASPSAPTIGNIIQPTCAISTGSVTVSGLPSGTWTLTRNPGGVTITGTGNSRTISGLDPNTYTFTVTNAAGCTSGSSASVVINSVTVPTPPTVGTINQPNCLVSTGTVVLGGLPLSGNWIVTRTPGGNTNKGTGPTAFVTNLSPGSYTFRVANAAGCVSSQSATVVINPQTAPPTVFTLTGDVICSSAPNTGTVTLSNSQTGVSYQLKNASNNNVQSAKFGADGSMQTWTGLPVGNGYYVVATRGGCTSQTGTANITITTAPTVFNLTGSSICSSNPNTGTIRLSNSQTGVSYQLKNGSNNNVQSAKPGNNGSALIWTGLAAGNGYYVLASRGGCSNQTATANVSSVAAPNATISYSGGPFCRSFNSVNVTRTGTAGGTYASSPAGLSINSTSGAIFLLFSQPGLYTVKYTVSNGSCTTVAQTTVRINNCFGNNASPDPIVSNPKTNLLAKAGLAINIRPIPSQTFFTLSVKSSLSQQQAVQINIYDVNGKKVQQLKGSAMDSYHFGDTYVAGAYMVEVIQGTDRVTQMILKQ
ncbi:MAG TPA: T9SS type A sorting domain-containing protein, partial [Chitinophagaceae bacterium]|nr:T9SS type A sorting domain-containing protein [Chitinophagaceae bacterium]